MRISLGLVLSVVLCAATDSSATPFIKTAARTYLLEGDDSKPLTLRSLSKTDSESLPSSSTRLEASANGLKSIDACGDPSTGPRCLEIAVKNGRYYLPPLRTLFMGDTRPQIVFRKDGKRVVIPLPMDAGRLHSVEIGHDRIKVFVFAQDYLGSKVIEGKTAYGVSHKGVYKSVIYHAGAARDIVTLDKEPAP